MGVFPGWGQAHGPSRVLVATAGARRHRGLLRLCRDEALGPPTNARWCAKGKAPPQVWGQKAGLDFGSVGDASRVTGTWLTRG
jgi:hypothetical protein